jgi:O-antigen/teichoic acid export membrane protein
VSANPAARPIPEAVEPRRLRVAALSRLAGAVVTAVAGLVTTALLLSMLGASGYGTLAFGLSTVVLLAVVAQLGLGTAAMQRIATYEELGDADAVVSTVRGAMTIITTTSTVAAVVVVVVQLALSPLPPGPSLLVGIGLSLLLLGTNVAMTASFTARGLSRFVLSEAPPALIVLLQLGGVLVLRRLSLRTETDVALAYGIVGVAAGVIGVSVIRWLVPSEVFVPARRAAGDVLRIAIPFAVAGVALQAIAQADVFALGLVRPPAQVGAYEPVVRVLDRFMLLVPMLLLAGFVPIASRVWARGDAEPFRSFFRSSSKAGFVLALPVIAFFAAFPAALPRALFGAAFPVSPTVVRILLVGYTINVAFGLNTGALVAVGDAGRLRRPYVWTFVVMFVLAALLTPTLGAVGAALATTGSYLFLNVAVSVVLARSTGVHLLERSYALVVGSGLAVTLALAIAPTRSPSLLASVLLSGLVSAVWFGVVLAAGWVSRADIALFVPLRGDRP